MNAADAQKLARRFIELPQDKRRLFLAGMAREGINFAQLPMTACIGAAERDGLSYAQQRMWFLWQMDPQSAAYNLPMAVRLSGELQPEALEQAFSLLAARHECLRTTFGQEGEQAFQKVAEPQPVKLTLTDLSALPEDQRWPLARQHMMAEATQAFDLENGPLLSLRLLRLDAQEHVLLLTLHHIIADGWSMNILIDEFMRTYDALVAGREPQLPAITVLTATMRCGNAAGWRRASASVSSTTGARNWATNTRCLNCRPIVRTRPRPVTVARVWKRSSTPACARI